jgi:hypothetical protein
VHYQFGIQAIWETFVSFDFWSDQIVAAFHAWAIPLAGALSFWAAFKIKFAKTKQEMRAFKEYTEAIESRLQLARDLNIGEANRLAELRTEIDGLRQLIKVKAKPQNENKNTGSKDKPTLVEVALKEVNASAASLAMTNSATDHILTAETLAIGDLENKQRLRLVPRPSDGPNKRSR